MLDVVLKIAPQELRAPAGNTDFLMELYEMRQTVIAAVKREKEADERRFAKEMAKIEADENARQPAADTRPLDI